MSEWSKRTFSWIVINLKYHNFDLYRTGYSAKIIVHLLVSIYIVLGHSIDSLNPWK